MADPKDPKDPKNEGFLRKVVRFVANPATDWADLNTRQAPDSTLEAERSELKLRRLIDETSLDDVPRAPKRVDVDPQQLIAELQPGDWLQLINSNRELVLAKVAWINERRSVVLLLQHPDRLILSRHLSAIANRARRGRVFLVR